MDKPATPYGADHPTALSPTVPREEVHNRRVSCNGFVREDGLFDIEAEMTDNKSYAFPTEFRGDVTPEQFVHHMKVRVTVDSKMKVHAAEALTIAGPYAICAKSSENSFGSQAGLTRSLPATACAAVTAASTAVASLRSAENTVS